MAAEFVGGSILAAVIEVLAKRLSTPEILGFFKSHKLNGGVLEKMEETLNTLNGLLDDAEEKQITRPAVKKWLDDARHAVYEAEDLMEVIDYERLRSKDKAASRRVQNRARNLFRILDPDNKRIKEMEAELQKIYEKLERLVKHKGDLRHIEGNGGGRPLSEKTTPVVDESHVYGREADKEAIMEYLLTQNNTNGSNVGVIPIVGMGGVGKTTLAQLIYNDKRVEECFELKAWVWASQQFDVTRIIDDILKKINGGTCGSKEPDESLMEENFASSLSWMENRALGLEGENSCTLPERTRHLSITSTLHDGVSKIFPRIHGVKHLRTLSPLTYVGGIDSEVLNGMLTNLKHLRMLSLYRWSYKSSQLPNSIGNLKHLRHLDLSQTLIERLPENVSSLYYLQTLLLRECRHLIELPSNISNLDSLQHLDIEGTNLKEMPPKMGKLTKLRTLQYYVVGKESGSSMKELGKLSCIRKKLSIRNLRDVANAQDALDADLKGKKKIERLKLIWDGNMDNTQQERDVLEKLEPSENVKQLAITGYGGTMFPGWFGNSSFSNMVALKLSGCKNCFSLPPLGQLSCLEELQIKGFDEVRAVSSEFYGSDSLMEKPFKSLKILKFKGMKKWKEWNTDVAGAFPHLAKLLIAEAPLLTEINVSGGSNGRINASLDLLPQVSTLTVKHCLNLESLRSGERSLPALRHLTVRNCSNLVSLPKGGIAAKDLRSLVLEGCLYLKSLPENMHSLLPSLEDLQLRSLPEIFWERCGVFRRGDFAHLLLQPIQIKRLGNLKSVDCKGFHHLTSLSKLSIESCPMLESISEQALPSSIEYLHLRALESLDCIGLQQITSLRKLKIWGCPKLASLQGLPSSLECLQLWDQQDWDYKELHHFTSLRTLMIKSPKLEFLPENMLPSSIESLEIWNLEDLECKGLRHLTSLRNLHISSSPMLEFVPGEGTALLPCVSYNLRSQKS
ncbi:hypothetical protein OIU85_007087 [Salix viminalis]|uniref:Rx N-terminal domain-containing protein n=1 Tax=Salix viminalis TaxID=40686 RepID=A0A9Q0P808_SALVM|nr:hypothetical protein OIU85_007087 [Salix viminalis]